MSDVTYHQTKQGWVFKAMTAKAKEAMGTDMGGPWRMAADVFWQGVPPERFEATIAKLQGLGLDTSTPPPKQVDVSKYLAD